MSALEWCVFVCNHSARGDHWKKSFTASPQFIRAVMANGNKSVSVNKATVAYCAVLPFAHTDSASFVIRVSDTSRHVGGERPALSPAVAVYVSQRITPAFLDSGPRDPAAGYRPSASSISWGRFYEMSSNVSMKSMQWKKHPMCFSVDVVYTDAHLLPDQWRRAGAEKGLRSKWLTAGCLSFFTTFIISKDEKINFYHTKSIYFHTPKGKEYLFGDNKSFIGCTRTSDWKKWLFSKMEWPGIDVVYGCWGNYV